MNFDAEAVLFGASAHDIGKVLHVAELAGPGNKHEADGPGLLEQHGVTSELARFARTHGAWSRESLTLEDLLAALADWVWEGQRLEVLEAQDVGRIAKQAELAEWTVFAELDTLLTETAERGNERPCWESRRIAISH